MSDTWVNRDLPVLTALVQLVDETGHAVKATKLEQVTGFDGPTVQRALRALNTEEPAYFTAATVAMGNHVMIVGGVTGKARRAVGAWPTPENVTSALLDRLELLANDEGVSEDNRSRARRIRDALADGGGAVLTGVLTTVLTAQMGM